jgi:hypothetical protein
VFGFPETPDSTIGFAGGDNFVYRLTLATSGWVRSVRPLAFQRQQATGFELVGIGLPEATVSLSVPDKFEGSAWPLSAAGLAHAPMLDVVDLPQAIEPLRPEGAAVPEIAVPGSMTGTLLQPRERDRYRFQAKKDTKLAIALASRRLGYPMDGVLRVLDATGKQLAREDDTAKEEDSRLVFQAPADGEYTLEVGDAFMAAGPAWLYRVDIQPIRGDVGLTVKEDRHRGKLNEEFEIPVAIERRNGFDQPLLISVQGAGDAVTCPAVKAEKDAKEVKLKLKATAAFRGPIRIVAQQESDPAWSRTASAASDLLLRDIWLTVK